MTCPTRTYYYNSGEIWYQNWLVNGLPHKTDGPAIIYYYRSGKIAVDGWFLNGKRIYPDNWLKENNYKWPLTEDQQTELLLRFR